MIDREKVIEALECLANNPFLDCDKCPYNAPTLIPLKQRCDYTRICANALDLLKAHEPRVLTLDEVLNAEDFVWAEIWTPGDRRWCLIYARINKSIYDDILMLHEDSGFRWTRLASNYNMKSGWRCWSARPTEEQRKNTPWEGEKE